MCIFARATPGVVGQKNAMSPEGASQNHAAPLMLRTSRAPPIRARGPGVSLPARSETAPRSHPSTGRSPEGTSVVADGRAKRHRRNAVPLETFHPAKGWQKMHRANCIWHPARGPRIAGARVSVGVVSFDYGLPPQMPSASTGANVSRGGRAPGPTPAFADVFPGADS